MRYAFVKFFVNSTRWHEEGAIIHLTESKGEVKQYYIILWYISSLKNQTFKLTDTTTEGQTKRQSYFNLLCNKMWSNGKLASRWWAQKQVGNFFFLKAQIAVSGVLGRQHFNTAIPVRSVSWGQSSSKQMKDESFGKTVEQLKDPKEDLFLKTVSHFSLNKF